MLLILVLGIFVLCLWRDILKIRKEKEAIQNEKIAISNFMRFLKR